ncbi:myb-like protein X [Hyposmocoma kahamanoa]|uniref:myb-like protein X n=1 Tax=Hyposmocoma kahamanoa TaxID=1477025 RepID=UPI000E6D7D7A|nr:myb-like protein X [Hyposmocoma kahamanoa]
MESLTYNEKAALYNIEKAKEAIVGRDLIATDKYLREVLDLITVHKKNVSRNKKNNTESIDRDTEENEQYKRRKVNNVLERAIQTEAFKFIKDAEQAFFNYNFDEAEKLLFISKRISPDEYVEEMLALIENAKRESIPKERIENLRKTFFKQRNAEQDKELNNFDFAKTFKIYNGFDKAEELLKAIENLYTEEKAKEFFRQIQIATENQRPSNYNYCGNKSSIHENIKVEAYKCLLKAKEDYREGSFETAEQLSKKSDRMYPIDDAKALLNDIRINLDEYEEEHFNNEYEDEEYEDEEYKDEEYENEEYEDVEYEDEEYKDEEYKDEEYKDEEYENEEYEDDEYEDEYKDEEYENEEIEDEEYENEEYEDEEYENEEYEDKEYEDEESRGT